MCNAPGGSENRSEKWTYFWSLKMIRKNSWLSFLALRPGDPFWPAHAAREGILVQNSSVEWRPVPPATI